MRYISVCSGIEASTVAWHPLGWEPAAFAEIEKFPSAVLAHHYPHVPNHGDFTTIKGDEYGAVDVLVGGTPRQDFSVAGLRAGMDGARGKLTVEFARLAGRLRPRWLVWENVPGVLSIDGGRAFGTFLGLLGELGYGFAYRLLDAQFFGVPQRRRRVFVVGYLGDWRRAAAVLFERHSLSGHPAPRREAGQSAAYDVAPSIGASGRGFERAGESRGQDCVVAAVSNALCSRDYKGARPEADQGAPLVVTHALRADGFDASEDGTGRGTPLVTAFNSREDCVSSHDYFGAIGSSSPQAQAVVYAIQERAVCENPDAGPDGAGFRDDGTSYTLESRTVPQAVAFNLRGRDGEEKRVIAFSAKDHGADVGEIAPTLRAGGFDKSHANAGVMPAVAFTCSDQSNSFAWEREYAPTLDAQIPNDSSNIQKGVRIGTAVRRLTPRECERLQGFPDDYTLVPFRGKPAADGPRYKALGNSMAVPVMRWIGERIQMMEAL